MPYKAIAKPLRCPKAPSIGEETLALHLRAAKIEFVREYQFMPDRKYRADFAILSHKLLIEVDGGQRLGAIGKDGKAYAIGRHGQDADLEKLNYAASLGYRVLRFSPLMVKSGAALKAIEECLNFKQ